MIDIIKAIVFGAVQGVTEFLPISSSGHLLILHDFFDLPIKNELAFDVVLHFASLLAVIIFFRKEIYNLIIAFLNSLRGRMTELSSVAWMIIFATIPAACAGVFLQDLIENKLRSILVVSFMLIVVALLFIFVEKRKCKSDVSYRKMSMLTALKIGFAQALALIPGTSRSGITIITGMSLGLKRDEAIKFSFLLSIPIILGASITKIPELWGSEMGNNGYLILSFSFLASFISAFLTIRFFLRYAKNNTLLPFAYYRIVLAVGLFVIWWFK